jgi:hypothetical protein
MKSVVYGLLLFFSYSIIAKIYYAKGLQETNFNRKIANNRLQNCIQIIKGNK